MIEGATLSRGITKVSFVSMVQNALRYSGLTLMSKMCRTKRSYSSNQRQPSSSSFRTRMTSMRRSSTPRFEPPDRPKTFLSTKQLKFSATCSCSSKVSNISPLKSISSFGELRHCKSLSRSPTTRTLATCSLSILAASAFLGRKSSSLVRWPATQRARPYLVRRRKTCTFSRGFTKYTGEGWNSVVTEEVRCRKLAPAPVTRTSNA
mmetsp:Transcript_77579/g.139987  ORF Transcript_77579/g.139987 Transcript_77579/m.139987 type:complete len:206 (-) Transcript_77579:1604-2221(-)